MHLLNLRIFTKTIRTKFPKIMFFRFSIFLLFCITSQFMKAQDWASLDHFRTQNEVLSPPEPNENRVVFMGNSITIGWLNARPEFFENKPYINRGISGQTTPQMLVRFRSDVIELQPKVVVILAGTNDIAGNTGPMTIEMTLDNLKSMSELSHINGIKVVLCSILPASEFPWNPEKEPHIKIPKLNQMIKQYAESRGFEYLDYFSELNDGNNGMTVDHAYDGVHPTVEAYMVMEKLLTQKLNSILE